MPRCKSDFNPTLTFETNSAMPVSRLSLQADYESLMGIRFTILSVPSPSLELFFFCSL